MKFSRKILYIFALSLFFSLFSMPALPCAGIHPEAKADRKLRLGDLEFPTSAKSDKTQALFVEGVLALHAFHYEMALQKFKQAAKFEPRFAMAYWGMAMSRTYLLWGQEDWNAGKKLLDSFAPTPEEREAFAPTLREKMFLRSVEQLYTSLPREVRMQEFADSLKRSVETFPNDIEAKSFYSLALLAIINPEEFGYEERSVGRLDPALEELYAVVKAAPRHPGGLHYLIHALDTPKLAKRAEPYLLVLKNVAPDASHLIHMPTHIFVRLGMWDRSIEFNTEAFYVASQKRDFHALKYLHYAYLQKGPSPKFKDLANQTMAQATEALGSADPVSDPASYLTLAEFRCRQAIEWREWSLMETKLPPDVSYPANWPWADSVVASQLHATGVAALKNRNKILFKGALGALEKRRFETQIRRDRALAEGEPFKAEREGSSVNLISILEHQLKAEEASELNNVAVMRREMENAVRIEDSLGPAPARLPFPMLPSHELFAELLGKHQLARSEMTKHHDFASRQVNRWRLRELGKVIGG